MFMSGTRATFTLKKGTKIDEKAIEKAIEKKKGIDFNSLTSRQMERAVKAYMIKTPVT